MARPCTICTHPNRKKIDLSLVEPNAKLSYIAKQFDVSIYALRRHIEKGHIAAKVQKVKNAQVAVEVETFLQKIQKKHTRFDEMADAAKESNDPHLELKVHHEQGRYFDLEGKACGIYREKVEHTGKDGGPIRIVKAEELSDDELANIAASGSK